MAIGNASAISGDSSFESENRSSKSMSLSRFLDNPSGFRLRFLREPRFPMTGSNVSASVLTGATTGFFEILIMPSVLVIAMGPSLKTRKWVSKPIMPNIPMVKTVNAIIPKEERFRRLGFTGLTNTAVETSPWAKLESGVAAVSGAPPPRLSKVVLSIGLAESWFGTGKIPGGKAGESGFETAGGEFGASGLDCGSTLASGSTGGNTLASGSVPADSGDGGLSIVMMPKRASKSAFFSGLASVARAF